MKTYSYLFSVLVMFLWLVSPLPIQAKTTIHEPGINHLLAIKNRWPQYIAGTCEVRSDSPFRPVNAYARCSFYLQKDRHPTAVARNAFFQAVQRYSICRLTHNYSYRAGARCETKNITMTGYGRPAAKPKPKPRFDVLDPGINSFLNLQRRYRSVTGGCSLIHGGIFTSVPVEVRCRFHLRRKRPANRSLEQQFFTKAHLYKNCDIYQEYSKKVSIKCQTYDFTAKGYKKVGTPLAAKTSTKKSGPGVWHKFTTVFLPKLGKLILQAVQFIIAFGVLLAALFIAKLVLGWLHKIWINRPHPIVRQVEQAMRRGEAVDVEDYLTTLNQQSSWYSADRINAISDQIYALAKRMERETALNNQVANKNRRGLVR